MNTYYDFKRLLGVFLSDHPWGAELPLGRIGNKKQFYNHLYNL